MRQGEPGAAVVATADYDKVISLDPQDYAALNDRGIAKMQLGNYYGAISDISAAIAIRKRDSSASFSNETRSDAYIKTRQWDLAILHQQRQLVDHLSRRLADGRLAAGIQQRDSLCPQDHLGDCRRVVRPGGLVRAHY